MPSWRKVGRLCELKEKKEPVLISTEQQHVHCIFAGNVTRADNHRGCAYKSSRRTHKMSVSHLHRYVYFYQSENALAFSATISGAGPALVIDRATAGLSLQSSHSRLALRLIGLSSQSDGFPASTDHLWNNWDDSPTARYSA